MIAAWLIIFITQGTSGGWIHKQYPFATMQECRASISNAKVNIPNGGDAESTVTVVCVEGNKEGPAK